MLGKAEGWKKCRRDVQIRVSAKLLLGEKQGKPGEIVGDVAGKVKGDEGVGIAMGKERVETRKPGKKEPEPVLSPSCRR